MSGFWLWTLEARRLTGLDGSFGHSKGVRSLGSSEPALLLRRLFNAPISHSFGDNCEVVQLVARTVVGTVTGTRGLPMYSGDTESVSEMDEWMAGLGGFTTVPRGTSSSLSLLKASIAIRR